MLIVCGNMKKHVIVKSMFVQQLSRHNQLNKLPQKYKVLWSS